MVAINPKEYVLVPAYYNTLVSFKTSTRDGSNMEFGEAGEISVDKPRLGNITVLI